MTRGKGASLDIHRLHLWMWQTRTREGYLSVGTAELAAKLDVAKYSATRYILYLVRAGRLRRIGYGKYVVVDPEKYLWETKLGPTKRNQMGEPWKMRTDQPWLKRKDRKQALDEAASTVDDAETP